MATLTPAGNADGEGAMKEWWSDRQPRERTLIAGVGALMLMFAVFQFLILPLAAYRASARAEHEAALAPKQPWPCGFLSARAE